MKPLALSSARDPLVRREHAAEWLLSPTFLAAVLLLLLNDHWLKQAYPGWLTGKLSDFAGLFFFPTLLVSLSELCVARPLERRQPALLVAGALTAVAFAALKLSQPVTLGFEQGMAALWSAIAQLRGEPALPRTVHVARDASDLLALPMCFAPWARLRDRRLTTPRETQRRSSSSTSK